MAGSGALLASWQIVALFAGFASAYFLSALLRAVTATLAPVFRAEFGLSAGELGLLAGAYFLGFSLMQLPVGAALDRLGPRRVLCALLSLAVAGCAGFAMSEGLVALVLSRVLIGMGVAGCLMAPLTSFRQWYPPALQLRANAWMLMTGSLGMIASTVPVHWLQPMTGWRALFWLLAAALLVSVALTWRLVPADRALPAARQADPRTAGGYRAVLAHPLFRRLLPLGFFGYGGLIAMQSLWVGPWLTRVTDASAAQAAQGLLLVNTCMMVAFLTWGSALPWLERRGLTPVRLVAWGMPTSLVVLLAIVLLGSRAGAWHWAAWCVATSVVTLSQPAVGQALPAEVAGRALSAFNLAIFSGVFLIQWAMGLFVDLALHWGWSVEAAFRSAAALLAAAVAASWVWLVTGRAEVCR
jgi:MFS family permease